VNEFRDRAKQELTPKVLWVTPNLSGSSGGPTTTTVNGIIAERGAGLRTEILTTVDPDGHGDSRAAIERLDAAGVRVRCFPRVGSSRGSQAWGLSPAMALWMVRHLGAFDLVHVQYVWCMTSVISCLLARFRGMPVVVTPHESLTDHDIETASRNTLMRISKRALRLFYLRTVDCLIFMSELEERDTKSGNVPTVRISHAVAQRVSSAGRPASSDPRKPLNIGFLGRNARKKGINRLLSALKGPGPQSEWHLTLATSSLTSEQIEIIESAKAQNRVNWLGFISDPDDLFSQIDVLVMPSTYEAFGMVAAEAMAHGLPVVVSKHSGVAEIVSEYEAGIVLDEASVGALVAALVRFDDDRASWARYGANGRRAVEERLTYRVYAAATGALYNSLV
jgi:glycosyltransferase involved in cell wall biosynthesis